MAYQPHIRVTARFNLGPGTAENENASCTLNFSTSGFTSFGTVAGRKNKANQIFDAWAAYVTGGFSRTSTAVRLMETRCYKMEANGRADGPPGISDKAPVKGDTSGNQHPFQVTNCVTLVAEPGGKGRFGRIYLPPQGFEMEQDTGRINPVQVGQMAQAAFDLINDCSDSPLIDAGWGVRIAGSTGTGTLREPVEIRFGRVPDTQRRRRTNLLEGYWSQPFTA